MEYSVQHYRLIIERALKSGYTFVPFRLGPSRAGQIYLRHDIDYSLEMALKVAQINADLNVSGTFFVLLRSQIYNLLTPWSQSVVQRIHALGQHIALHFPAGSSTITDIETNLKSDFAFARNNLPILRPIFSWHNPTEETLQGALLLSKVAGLLNVYASNFIQKISYFSDSNMRNSADSFLRLVTQDHDTALQLLFHPFNWVAGGSTMSDVFAGTWPYIVREREYEVRLNRAYQQMLPEGMPLTVLKSFADQWRRAAETKEA